MTETTASRPRTILLVFFAVFVFTSAHSIALAQMSLGLALLTFIYVAIAQRHRPFVRSLRWFYIPAALYVAWLLPASLLGDTPSGSLSMAREEWLFLAVPAGVYLFRTERYRRVLVTVLASAVALVSLYALLQYVTGVNWFKEYELTAAPVFGYRVQGGFSHRLTFANYFGVAAMFLLGYAAPGGLDMSPRRRKLLATAGCLAMLVTILTFSRMAVAACVITLVLLAVLMGRRYWLPVVGLVVVLAVVIVVVPGIMDRYVDSVRNDLNPQYEGSRLFIWSHTAEIIGEHPLFGVGPGNFYEEYKSRLAPGVPAFRQLAHAHNDVLNVAAVAGIPGALFFELLWLLTVIHLWRGFRRGDLSDSQRRLSLAALLASVVFWLGALTEATFVDEEVRQMLMFTWAAGLSVWYKDNVTPEDRPARHSA